MIYGVMVLFYLLMIIVGRWLFVNRGKASSGVYTVRKMMPWSLGFIITAFVMIRIHRDTVATFGSLKAWAFYIFFFLLMSLCYRATMMITKDFSTYCVDEFVTDENFFSWLKQRKEQKEFCREKYGVKKMSIDIDVASYFIGALFIMSIVVMIRIL